MRGQYFQWQRAFVIASGALVLARCGLDQALIDSLLERLWIECPVGGEGAGPLQGSWSSIELCVLPRAEGSRWPAALRVGFGVPALDLRRLTAAAPTDAARFTWTPPANARVVTCALLGCPPVVAPRVERCADGVCIVRGQGSPDVFTRRVIVNYAQCVIVHREYEPPMGEFDLNTVAPTAQTSTTHTLYTGLYVACWAYDGNSLTAASDVLRLSPAEVTPTLRASLAAPCAPSRPTMNCLLEDATFGTCAGDTAGEWACRPRCFTSRDCCERTAESADASALACEADAAVDPMDERCERATNDRTGACLPARSE